MRATSSAGGSTSGSTSRRADDLSPTGACTTASGPPSALDAIRDLGPALGQVAVVDVGYNDTPSGFAAGIDRVMRALVDAGVDQVVWITLRERRPMSES